MKVKVIPTLPGDAWWIPGDIHFDAQDDEALDIFTQIGRVARVNKVCLIGDTHDCAGISHHGRPARNFRLGKGTLKAEYKAAKPWFTQWESMVGLGNCYTLTGNHEHWHALLQDEYPGLLDTEWPELYGDLYDGWHVFGEDSALRLGSLFVCHGHRLLGSLAKYSAASVLANYPGQNTLYGHTHRVDACTTPTSKNGEPVAHGAWTIGHMRRPQEELAHPKIGMYAVRHRQGGAIVHITDDGRFQVEQVTIDRHNGKPYAMFRGYKFEA